MKIMYKITIIASTLVIISLLIGSVFLKYYIKESNEFLLEELFEHKKLQIEEFINALKDDFELQIYDYTVWDEVYYNVNSKNTEWLKDNASYFLFDNEKYNMDLIFLRSYNNEYEEFYCDYFRRTDLEQSNHWNTFVRQDEIHISFDRINNELYILASNRIYDNSMSQSNGYYTMGKLIDGQFLNRFNKLNHNDNAYIQKLDSEAITYKMNGNKMELRYPLVSQGQENFGLKIYYDFNYLLNNNLNIFKKVANVLTSLFLVSFFVLFWYLKTLSNQLNGVIDNISSVINGDYSVNLQFRKTKEMKELSQKVNILAKTIENKISEIKRHQLDTLQIIIQAVEEKDTYTRGHSERVSQYAQFLAEQYGYKKKRIKIIAQSALIHDIGKIGIKDDILNKPGKLTNEEYEEIKTHTEKGYKILADAHYFKPIVEIVRHHHERYDGKGYPDGLKGNEISMSAKILAVADTFDAMTSSRIYRGAMDYETALEIIKNEKGKQFDPEVVDVLLNARERLSDIYFKLHNI